MRLPFFAAFIVATAAWPIPALAASSATEEAAAVGEVVETSVAGSQNACMAIQYAMIFQDHSKTGAQVPPDYLNHKTLPLAIVRARMQNGDSDTKFMDKAIESGCLCVMDRWTKRYRKATTFAEVKAVSAAMSEAAEKADFSEDKACWKKASRR